MTTTKKTALITGASKGLGLALATVLAKEGWQLLINARNAAQLRQAQLTLGQWSKVEAISGDVRDEIHLLQFPERLAQNGWQLDLVVNNASILGASPQPALLDLPIEALHQIFHTNALAPISLLQKVRPFLRPDATIINISSDAAVHTYETWGGYGSSKAAVDHWTSILAKENPHWNVYSVDPGDMRTDMHQAAYPGEDLSHLPLPDTLAVPGILHLIKNKRESGRYVAEEIGQAVLV
jgi:NAD(P)-dependent dehydrogenase (short-subunit alcohol dehydrogenase family)